MYTRKYELKIEAEKTPLFPPICSKSDCTIFWIRNVNYPSSLKTYTFYTKREIYGGFVLQTDGCAYSPTSSAREQVAVYEKSNRILVLLLCTYKRKREEL